MAHDIKSTGTQNAKFWDPTFLTHSALSGKRKDASPLYAVVVVNQPVEDKRQLLDLCNGAKTVVYADGGANQIFHLATTEEEQQALVSRLSLKA